MRLCTLHNYYASVWQPETDYAPCTIIIHPCGYQKLMRLCTLHNYYASVWLPESDEFMHPLFPLAPRAPEGKLCQQWSHAERVIHACPPHVARMIQCGALTGACSYPCYLSGLSARVSVRVRVRWGLEFDVALPCPQVSVPLSFQTPAPPTLLPPGIKQQVCNHRCTLVRFRVRVRARVRV